MFKGLSRAQKFAYVAICMASVSAPCFAEGPVWNNVAGAAAFDPATIVTVITPYVNAVLVALGTVLGIKLVPRFLLWAYGLVTSRFSASGK